MAFIISSTTVPPRRLFRIFLQHHPYGYDGLGQTILLAGINLFGYIVPQSTAQIIAQPEAVTGFFRWCFAGLPTVLYGICAVIMLLYKPNQK